MIRRFLSHLLISLAVFVLTATLFIWTIDGRVLNADVVSGELRKAGVSQELANLIPEIATHETEEAVEDYVPDEVPQDLVDEVSDKEEELVKNSIKEVITAEYVDSKISAMTASIITYIREGESDPVLDLSDFPERIKTVAGIEKIDTSELDEQFSEPIQLNEDGGFENIHNAYNIFSLLKYVGLGLFALIMLAEWFVAEKGKKLKRVSRVFLYAGLWFALYWGLIVLLPQVFGDALRSSVQGEFDASGLIDAVVKALQGLFAGYFLTFAIGSLFIATVLYLIRHFMHGDVVTGTPTTGPAKSKNKK